MLRERKSERGGTLNLVFFGFFPLSSFLPVVVLCIDPHPAPKCVLMGGGADAVGNYQ